MRTVAFRVIVALWLGACGTTGARADAPPSTTSDTWTFSLTPYFWFAGLSGDVAVNPNLPVVNVDLDFDQIFDHIDWWPPPVMLAGEARYQRFAVLADFLFLGLEAGAQTVRGPIAVAANLSVDTLITSLAGSYRVVEEGRATLDLLAGGRLWNLDADGSFVGPLAVRERSGSKTWVDPIIGAVAAYDLGGGFALKIEGDVGGFGVSADSDWQVVGTIQYAIGECTRLEVGYRHLAVDYSDGGFLFDVAMDGPIIAATFRF